MSTNRQALILSTTLFGLGALSVLGAPACGPTSTLVQEPPTIERLNIESTNVTPGLTIALSADVVGQGNITYLWEAVSEAEGGDGGSFTEPDSDSTTWTAPLEEGVVDIIITVRDSRGIATTTVPVLVGPGVDGDGDGYAVVQGDCDDANADIYPGAPELPDNIDNDCDGQVDEGSDEVDDDADGFSDLAGDCDDTNAEIYPGATETINGIDDDCDGLIDDNTEAFDDDGDGFTEQEGDCNDTNAGINPAATELLDAVDNDCDGVTDENTVGYDDDGDGYTELEGDCDDGDTDTYPSADELPDGEDNDCNGQIDDGSFITDDDGDGYTDLAGDCDDTNPYTYPNAPEYLDGFDNNCNGVIDESMNTVDNDGDGYSEAQGDCNDANIAIYPGAIELDDGIDNDCDGLGYTSPPIAVATVTGQQQACAPVQLSAANSYDPDGDTLDFTWFFTTRPPLSDLTDDDILDRFGMTPSFVPDASGYWAVALQVTDGYFQSSPATVGFTVAARPGNNPPVAQFTTSNENLFLTSNCASDAYSNCTTCPACVVNQFVDASPSSDADGDPLWFEFDADKISGDGINPDVTVNTQTTATVEINVGTSCGNTTSGLFEISVQVKDCNGATDDTSLQVNLSCQAL